MTQNQPRYSDEAGLTIENRKKVELREKEKTLEALNNQKELLKHYENNITMRTTSLERERTRSSLSYQSEPFAAKSKSENNKALKRYRIRAFFSAENKQRQENDGKVTQKETRKIPETWKRYPETPSAKKR
jgi:hypothetical protein